MNHNPNTSHLEPLSLQLSVEEARTGFRVRLSSPQGEADTVFALPCPEEQLVAFTDVCRSVIHPLERLAGSQEPWFVQAVDTSSEVPAVLARRVGAVLFKSILNGRTAELYRMTLNAQQHEGRPIEFRLNIEPPRLSRLPWELLYDPAQRLFLAVEPHFTFWRYSRIQNALPPLQVESPLRILALISVPLNLAPLDTRRELESLTSVLEPLERTGTVSLLVKQDQITYDELREVLDQFRPHVIHYMGHAGYDSTRSEGMLYLSDIDRNAQPLLASDFAVLLRRNALDGDDRCRFVFVNACKGAAGSDDDPASSLAQTLIHNGVPSVLAASERLADKAAVAAANAFYSELAGSGSVDAAVSAARAKVQHERPHRADWAGLELHMHATSGRLFSIKPAPPTAILEPHCCLIFARSEGIGFWVNRTHIVTSASLFGRDVVAHRMVDVALPDGTRCRATIHAFEPELDVAILTPHGIPRSSRDLKYHSMNETRGAWYGLTLQRPDWLSVGQLDGEIMPQTSIRAGAEILELSLSVASQANLAKHPSILAGSPLYSGGAIVGMLRGDNVSAVGGRRGTYLFATPWQYISRLLSRPTVHGNIQRTVEPTPLRELLPPLEPDEYHVFISYSSKDHEWVRTLVQALEQERVRCFLDNMELVAGSSLFPALNRALQSSKAGLIVLSEHWHRSMWCQDEAAALMSRASREPGFSLVAVRIDDSNIPALIGDSRVRIDVNQNEPPRSETVQRILAGLLGETEAGRPALERSARYAVDENRRLLMAKLDAAGGERSLMEHLERLRCDGILPTPIAERAALRFIELGRPDSALRFLDEQPDQDEPELVRPRALALSKCGKHQEACELLEPIVKLDKGRAHPDTLSILARCHKAMYWERGDRAHLERAFQLYLKSFHDTKDAYPGINAAAMALHRGSEEEAAQLAGQCIDILGVFGQTHDLWTQATWGEAYLLQGNLPKALEHYSQAAAMAACKPGALGVMREQAFRNLERLEALDQDGREEFMSVFPELGVVAFAGHMVDAPDRKQPRFPAERVDEVRTEIAMQLKVHNACIGFSSAARGSDILFIDEMLKRGGKVHVWLPFPREAFKETSVGFGWDELFDRVLSDRDVTWSVLSDELPPEQDKEAAFMACTRRLQKEAIHTARTLYVEPMLLAVWNGTEGDGAGGTADAVQEWRRTGKALGEHIIRV